MKIKYGKSFKDIIKIKQSFFDENHKYLQRQKLVGKIYSKQPLRKNCKVCEETLPNKYFVSNKVKYTICSKCSHLNGKFVDSDTFCDFVYNKSVGQNYADRYFSKNIKIFNERKNNIYKPKVNFLVNSIGKKVKKMKLLDVGAGSGYLLAALLDLKFKNAQAIEPSKKQVEFCKKFLKLNNYDQNLIKEVSINQTLKVVKETDSEIISMIGVLEHLNYPRQMLETIKSNKRINYVYLSVPLFSFTVLIESCFSNIHNRHLGGSHTHLFTEKSLKKLMLFYGFKPISEWWFGADFLDLFRSIYVTSKQQKNDLFNDKINQIYELIDDFQKILDRKKLSSEVHIVFKRK